ncbi:SDR family oxidoreductase [Pelodictyon phaeoclathratiforme]|jgi:nucleoside-diphosphate-sugar epimerase|uniref:NAD-dependent epimerase/dehydratase n=1 Tax=Pelodictyon phaeoclathratiforme (strain DSM 5477 / BU-1) TaxID=324925 RepID=B4SFV8_PELPB|nr:SDR family oxidoreductase [Pelodictyon phaeoclathratiforme]ACF44785.1 NAD-dependent epimerase/dehydratase [Pelodictyon phaeoclathratiforme BU-1]MBV5289795.1 SDR family oxidoreductase [Pelodictyon phaeoclathratiforme]
MKKETITILGCGWLGLPLAQALVKEGYSVKGSTTREEKLEALHDAGVEPWLVRLDPEVNGDDIVAFLQSDTLIVNIPPLRRDDIVEYHIEQFSSLIDALGQSPVRSVLLVSSTSVYPALNREVTEEDAVDPESLAGQALLLVEEMLMQESAFQTTVLRFGGLIGYDRNPAKYLATMAEIAHPDQPMNLIHRDDCIRIITEIIRLKQWGEVFNACSPLHPLRKEYYGRAAEIAGLPAIPLSQSVETAPYKVVNSEKLISALHYHFLYPDPVVQLG